MAFVLLLLPEHQQEVVAQAGVHDDPVHGRREVHVGGQEDDLCPVEHADPVAVVQVADDHLQMALPFAGEQRAGAGGQLGVVDHLAAVELVFGFCGGLSSCTLIGDILQIACFISGIIIFHLSSFRAGVA